MNITFQLKDDGTKGTLIDAYGLYADDKISKFIHDLENFQKEAKL